MSMASVKRSGMTLYSRSHDPYSHKVRLVLAEKAVACEILDVDTHKARDEFIEIGSAGMAPALLDRDLVLYHSNIIAEYLDERFPHPPLMPVYPVARAKTRLLLHRIQQDWYSQMDLILGILGKTEKDRSKDEKAGLLEAQKKLRDGLLSVGLAFSQTPYFFSEEFSLLDVALLPLLWRLGALGIQLDPEVAQPILNYQTRLFGRESFQQSLSEAERQMNDFK